MNVRSLLTRLVFCCASLAIGLSLAASLGALVSRGRHLSVAEAVPALVALLVVSGVFSLAGFAARSCSTSTDRAFLGRLLPVVFVLKLAWAFAHMGYPQLADHGIFLDFVNRLARARFGVEELVRLSASYDYYIWVSRGFPFLHLLARVFPEHHVFVATCLNAFLQCVTVLLADRIAARLLVPRSVRRAGAVLLAGIPFHWWQMLEYGHHILSTCLLAGVTLSAMKMGESEKVAIRVSWSVLIGILLAVLSLQLGVDQLGFFFAAFAAGVAMLSRRGDVQSLRGIARQGTAVILGLAISVCIWLPAKQGYFRWQASFDEHHHSSGVLGFMARGWSFETWGEYDGRYEQMDKLTPTAEKRDSMMALVLSRIREQPVAAFGVLLPVKVAKYGLIGFATTAEDSLAAYGRPFEVRLFRWLRLLFAPLFLLFALMAVVRAGAAGESPPGQLLPSLYFLAACGIFTLMGETSPRYSIYVQPFMAMLAAVGVASCACASRSRVTIRSILKAHVGGAAVVGLVYCLVAWGAWMAARALPLRYVLARLDAAQGGVAIPHEVFAVGLPEASRVESEALPAGWATFYAWRTPGLDSGRFVVRDGTGILLDSAIADLPPAGLHRVHLATPGRLRFETMDGGLDRIGYLRGGL